MFYVLISQVDSNFEWDFIYLYKEKLIIGCFEFNKKIQIFIKQSWTFIATRRFEKNPPFIKIFFWKKKKVVFANVSKIYLGFFFLFSKFFSKNLLIKGEFLSERLVAINVQNCFIKICIFLLNSKQSIINFSLLYIAIYGLIVCLNLELPEGKIFND